MNQNQFAYEHKRVADVNIAMYRCSSRCGESAGLSCGVVIQYLLVTRCFLGRLPQHIRVNFRSFSLLWERDLDYQILDCTRCLRRRLTLDRPLPLSPVSSANFRPTHRYPLPATRYTINHESANLDT
ncbi:hypothetical protein J6590_017878 [Homalodisca vitripennis]|nr:hypothetical protein J6590_017878 [Homalodisca vitripennis]